MTDNNTASETMHFAFGGAEPTSIGGDYADSYNGVTASCSVGAEGNMDAVAWADTQLGLLVAVCDGMGPAGERAARVAIKAVGAHMRDVSAEDDAVENLRIAISAAHFAVRTLTERTADGSGATIAVLLLGADRAVAAWLGDVRIYQLRGKTAVFRTTDHSKVMELVHADVLTDEQARTAAECHIVTRSLGRTTDDKPRVARLPYLRGDRFVVCTDGIWRTFPQKHLLKMLGRPRNPEEAVSNTLVQVKAEQPTDDMAIAVIDTNSNSTIKTRMRTRHKIILIVLAVLLAGSLTFNVLQYLDIIPGLNSRQPETAQNQSVATPLTDSIAVLDGKADGAEHKEASATTNSAESATPADSTATSVAKVTITGTGTPVERIATLENVVAGLNDTSDKTTRGEIVDRAVAEINAISAECADNATAQEYLAKASEFLRVRKYTVDGSATDVRNQTGAVCGQLRKARAALK